MVLIRLFESGGGDVYGLRIGWSTSPHLNIGEEAAVVGAMDAALGTTSSATTASTVTRSRARSIRKRSWPSFFQQGHQDQQGRGDRASLRISKAGFMEPLQHRQRRRRLAIDVGLAMQYQILTPLS